MDVHTATLTSGGSTLLPPVFARTLLGNSSYQGTNVQACAQAEWGPPAAATTDALAISACEWDQDTQQGADFAPAPPYALGGQPAASFDQVLTPDGRATAGRLRDRASRSRRAGHLRLGRRRNWQLHLAGQRAVVQWPGWRSMSAACEQVLQNAQQSQIPIPVPVYVSYSGATNTYTLLGIR